MILVFIADLMAGSKSLKATKTKASSNISTRGEEISILMGSRAFYEGWDSNRPNVTLFIIGVGSASAPPRWLPHIFRLFLL
jgi:hypothetical protein